MDDILKNFFVPAGENRRTKRAAVRRLESERVKPQVSSRVRGCWVFAPRSSVESLRQSLLLGLCVGLLLSLCAKVFC